MLALKGRSYGTNSRSSTTAHKRKKVILGSRLINNARKMAMTAIITPAERLIVSRVKEKFDRAMQLGSNEERVIHEFCDQMQIPFDKIASEDFSAFMRILSLSKLLKNPNNMRGKARPQTHRGTTKKKKLR